LDAAAAKRFRDEFWAITAGALRRRRTYAQRRWTACIPPIRQMWRRAWRQLLTLSKPAWHHADVAVKHRSEMALAGKAAIERDLTRAIVRGSQPTPIRDRINRAAAP